ncbi:RNA polymerase II transcription mediator [Coniochaeta hoffmannii]|uniref:Mediator of RNA polymerase II transcription subunit 21 n=1 Tax=Coniochaeta hoffmannii TaxID=91930 RepID=A0AA38S970_9PEZI|nr:RNA polymerase II transcription mediator [Coniochaeta hoffmannii]
MSDRLTQLQDAVDQLAHQMVATFYYVERHHGYEVLGPKDEVRDIQEDPKKKPIDDYPPEKFQEGILELARDLIVKEQQIEYLISSLPGLTNSERDQEQSIKDLEEELKVAEAQRLEAVEEKDEVLSKLDQVLRSVRRP